MTYTGSYTYQGDDPLIAALTPDDIAELAANWPISPDDITQTQYDVWLAGAYFARHAFDSLANTPGE